MTYTIKKAKIESWGYEITARGFHNIAPTVEAAVNYLKDRFGNDVKYSVKEPERRNVEKI
ncbi:hypothetical protein EI53_01230 [Fusobacterium naviforme]|nr:hypothetical protein F7P78_06150 [Fusobacterium naviforme]PSL10168.1 hypothetical protein EI53_01230 [Fusobacterium naviforme]STO27578.1 Uncharacterised protein [Fusobacterium naviforme]